ncbi:MAG: Gmad2 immunoglobulin-like domain-containing protein [bacterium]
MPIDIVKKNKKNSANINLKRRMVLRQENKKTRKQENKESFEERFEKRFSHLPGLAHKQKLKVIWSTVIFFSGVIIIFWFYLASRGVLFYKSTDKEEKNGLIKLSELASGFSKLKDISVNKISDKTDVILDLKNRLEAAVVKNEVINSLKDNLQKQIEGEYDIDSNKIVCDSGNLIATYPLPNYYINNPARILGRGKLPSGEFKIILEDSNGKILGESNGAAEKGQTMSAFNVELNYSRPETETGILQLYTLNSENGGKNDLISMPVNFILGLDDWNIYKNEEFGFELKYPKDLPVSVYQNGSLAGKEESKENGFYIDYFEDVQKLQESYTPDILPAYENLDLFLESKNLGENEKSVYIGGLKFDSAAGKDFLYRILEKETGEIAVIKLGNKEDNVVKILDEILATFKLAEPNLENWKEYKDIAGEFSFKYPDELKESEESGQIIFRGQDPDGFSFYFFSIEPQIDNLEKWIKESAINSEEEAAKYEDKSFGDAVLGVYYEAEGKKDDAAGGVKNGQRSFGYLFNHYGATYSFRTNNENFKNTFKNVLNSIKFNSVEEEND